MLLCLSFSYVFSQTDSTTTKASKFSIGISAKTSGSDSDFKTAYNINYGILINYKFSKSFSLECGILKFNRNYYTFSYIDSEKVMVYLNDTSFLYNNIIYRNDKYTIKNIQFPIYVNYTIHFIKISSGILMEYVYDMSDLNGFDEILIKKNQLNFGIYNALGLVGKINRRFTLEGSFYYNQLFDKHINGFGSTFSVIYHL
jgi:hypothetical protein